MKKKRKIASIQLNNEIEKVPVPIVSDALIATTGIADGRLLPLVIIDASSRPDIEDWIKANKYLGPGDAETFWGKLSEKDEGKIDLILVITKPSRCVVLLEFDIVSQGILVDLIVRNRGLILQCGREGDRLISTTEKDRILVEVPSKDVQEEWNTIFHSVLEKNFRKEGFRRHEAKKMSEEAILKLRKVHALRMKEA